ncbi:MAG: hydroxymethylbilane synthase, partial [Ktedonobacterales bacterium]
SMFVAELERALLTGALDIAVQPLNDVALVEAEARRAGRASGVDAAVHSLKDLPGKLTAGLTIAAIPAREDPRDALISRRGLRLNDLPHGAVVATSSLRRRAQLLHLRPDLRIVSIRGNVDTRLRKTLASDGPDATVLAVAGLNRLGLEAHITEYLPTGTLVPAVGQGALAVEARTSDTATLRLLRRIDDLPTRRSVTAERAVLATLGGGCQVPLGAHATLSPDGATLRLLAVVASLDGACIVRVEREGPANRPAALGREVARTLLRDGARAILDGIQQTDS